MQEAEVGSLYFSAFYIMFELEIGDYWCSRGSFFFLSLMNGVESHGMQAHQIFLPTKPKPLKVEEC